MGGLPMKHPFSCLFVAAALAACSSADRGSTVPEPSSSSSSTTTTASSDPVGGTDPDKGQTGSIGQVVCQSDADCVAKVGDIIDGLKMPVHLDRQYLGAACIAQSAEPGQLFAHPAICRCYFGWNGSQERTPQNAINLGLKPGCDQEGRSLDCLATCKAFTGCDPSVTTSCDAACASLSEELDADNAKTFDVAARVAKCSNSGARCDAVFRIESRCYTYSSYTTRTYDCSLTDDAILAADAMPPPVDNMAHMLDPDASNLCQ
jgi:hypothetical protein